MKKPACLLFFLIIVFSPGFMPSPQSDSHLSYPLAEIPKASAPLLPHITSADQLVPFAKVILQRDYIGQRLGWSIKGGERVLLIVNNRMHPWVIEALVTALHELNCPVEVIIQDRKFTRWRPGTREWADEALRLMEERLSKDLNTPPDKEYPVWTASGTPRPRNPGLRLTEEQLQGYDVIIGPQIGPRNQPGLISSLSYIATPELLSAARIAFPGEIMDFMEQKIWEVIRAAERVTVTGVQGTNFTFTWFPEWWEIVEGTHPSIRSAADQSTFNTLRPGRSEYAVFAGHLLLHPRYGAIEGSDASGTVASQLVDWGPTWPPLKIELKRGEIVGLGEGGILGDFWRRSLELTRDIQYPGFSRPGTGWIEEFALGTNPKVFGPMRVDELAGVEGRDPQDIGWSYARDRSGGVHAGYGVLGAQWWTTLFQMPAGHYHQYFFFLTYDVTTRDGRTVRVMDKGHLTFLDDPEVRALAARYGDPDQLLTEDWIPEVTPEGKIVPPVTRLIPYREYLKRLPVKIDDPRLIYRIPEHLKKFYGEDRVRYYNPEEFMEFYRKLGMIPVKRATPGD